MDEFHKKFLHDRKSPQIKACRGLLTAVIMQAFNDAITTDRNIDKKEARRFLDEKNELFCMYCHLLGHDPVYLAKKLQKAIRDHKLKPLKQFRK